MAAPRREDITTRLMVGLEVHVELATRAKMFTAAPNVAHPRNFEAGPNTLCDPVVLGLPGVLPVVNKQAVEMALRVGLALGCEIPGVTKWDRKSYYYPDLPKNYQISQYDQPLCGRGALEIPVGDGGTTPPRGSGGLKKVRIIRAHLEEDAGKLLHEAPGGYAIDHSIVDLNRAGTPLLEIVTEPDMTSPEEVVAFAQVLRDICRFLRVTAGVMQRGHIRFEPNINVVIEHAGREYRTPIVEIKNLNSFKALAGSVAYEYERQVEEWLETGKVMGQRAKSTRGWDDGRGVTTHQRHKEDADEYRYFPDPDLVPLEIGAAWIEALRADQPELPLSRRRRYVQQLQLGDAEADQLLAEPELSDFFEQVVAAGVEGRRAAALLLNWAAKLANQRGCAIHELGVTPGSVREIADLVSSNRIGSNAAERLLALCCGSDRSAGELAQEHGLLQVSDDSALEKWIDEAIAGNAKSVEAVKAGKHAAIGALVGAVMKLSKGRANAKVVQEKLRTKLLG